MVASVLTVACGSSPLEQPGAGTTDTGGIAGQESAGDSGAGGTRALELAPGQVAEIAVRADGSTALNLKTPEGDEQFILIVASTAFEQRGASSGYSVALARTESPSDATIVDGCSLSPSAVVAPDEEPPPSGPAPAEGSTKALQIPTVSGRLTIDARLISVGESSLVWVNEADPEGLDDDFVASLQRDFEGIILPRERSVFGVEPDTDGDGHVSLVFAADLRAIATFNDCDVEPRVGCAGNRGEYLYAKPPSALEPPYDTLPVVEEVLVHELAHLMHFQRKVLRNELPAWLESDYMIEGVGALAQDIIGYQTVNPYGARAGLYGLDQFSFADLFPNDSVYDEARDGELRGGAYLFSRFLYDRGGGDRALESSLADGGGLTLLRRLIDAPRSMSEELGELADGDLAAVALDFYTALAMSNREDIGGVAPDNRCFSYLPTVADPLTGHQRGTSPYAEIDGMRMTGPLVSDAEESDGDLRNGGVDLLLLAASDSDDMIGFDLRTAPEAAARVRVGRVR